MRNTVNWFELFVSDMPRAQAFYEQVLATKLRPSSLEGEEHLIFADDGVAGALVKRPGKQPSAEGSLVYLNCDGVLDEALGRVVQAGGKIVMPKLDIGPPGFIAVVHDTEGNAVGLHSERR